MVKIRSVKTKPKPKLKIESVEDVVDWLELEDE